MNDILHFVLHLEEFLLEWSHLSGPWFYILVGLIIFSETGLVVAAFLPGDGLLFSVGVIAASGAVNIWWLIPLLVAAAILGNTTNYFIGRYFGVQILRSRWRLVKPSQLEQAHQFYEKHGGAALILGRFLPFARTLVPFIAGMSTMDLRAFERYNIAGAILWIMPLTLAGYWFGNFAWVQANFGLIYLGLIVVTSAPFVIALIRLLWRRWTSGRKTKALGV